MKTRRPRSVSFRSTGALSPLLLGTAGLGAIAALASAPASAQIHHVETPQHVTRAVGVYEWTGDLTKPTAARFVPVSLFIDGHFEDAGLYLARPVPFALQPGDVYALERSGEPQGVLDLDLAHRVVTGKALADDNTLGAWYAFGRFTPESAPKAAPLKPSSHLSKLEQSAGPDTPAGAKLPAGGSADDRPHMSRRDGGATPSGTGAGSGSGSSGSGSGSSGSGSGSSGNGSGTSGGTGSSGASTGTSASDDDTDRPTLRRRDPSQDATRRRDSGSRSKTASVTAAGPALGDDPDRPILGHNSTDNAGTPELTGLPADLHQAVAVSDAAHNDNHPFARAWESPAERADTLSAMAALARTRLAEYMATNQLVASNAPLPATDREAAPAAAPPAAGSTGATGPKLYDDTVDAAAPPKLERGVPQGYKGGTTPTAGTASSSPSSAGSPGSVRSTTSGTADKTSSASHTPAHSTARHSAAHAAPTRPAALTLAGEEIAAFTLSYGGLPTLVFTAAASVTKAGGQPTGAPATSGPATGGPSTSGPVPQAAYITVVAQRLASGELQVALSAATDDAHLDRGPRLRLVDAVDPDDSHRASLLFELRGASSRQFALYRLTSAHAEQTFTTASIE